ncbi:MAG: hypothetical protein ACR2LV_05535 [Solirubrobacteraceae bacterium]
MAEQHGGVDPPRQALLEVLQRHGVQGIIIGGAAIQTHGSDYRTDDIDLAPARETANLQRLADALNELSPELVIKQHDPRSTVPLPAGYFTARGLRNQQFWNLATRHGDVDICFQPAGFPGGYDDLRPHATIQAVAGTTIALPIASLADVEHSKRTADRPKDRAYFQRQQTPAAHNEPAESLDQLGTIRRASFPHDPQSDPPGPGSQPAAKRAAPTDHDIERD